MDKYIISLPGFYILNWIFRGNRGFLRESNPGLSRQVFDTASVASWQRNREAMVGTNTLFFLKASVSRKHTNIQKYIHRQVQTLLHSQKNNGEITWGLTSEQIKGLPRIYQFTTLGEITTHGPQLIVCKMKLNLRINRIPLKEWTKCIYILLIHFLHIKYWIDKNNILF